MKLVELRRLRAEAVENFATLIETISGENREATEDEQATLAGYKASVDDLKSKIENLEWIESERAGMAAPAHVTGGAAAPIEHRVRASLRGRLKAFHGADAHERAFQCGMWVAAAIMRHPQALAYCREHGMPITPDPDGVVRQAAGEATNPLGGYLVPEQFLAAVIDQRELYGVFRREVRTVPMSRDSMVIPRRVSGLTAYAVGEGDEGTESDKNWAQVRLTARKWMVRTRLSTEISEDSAIALADDLVSEMAYAFAVAEDTAGFKGDGSSTHHGIEGVAVKIDDGNHTASVQEAAAGNTSFATIDATDLSNVMAKVPEYVLDPRWYVSRAGDELMFNRLVQVAGGTTMRETVEGRPRRQYLGYDIVSTPVMHKDTGAGSGNILLLFGDLSLSSLMGDRRMITVASSEHVHFYADQIGLKATERFDINHHSLGDTADAGPVVALKTP